MHPERCSSIAFRAFVPGELVASSPAEDSSALLIRRYLLAPEQPESYGPATAEPHIVAIARGAAIYEERGLNGPWQRCTVRAGDLFVTGTREPYECRWRTLDGRSIEAVHLHVGLPIYMSALRSAFGDDASGIDLVDRAAFPDAFLSAATLHAGADLLARDPCARLMREALARTLAMHLIRHYTTRRERDAHVPRALSAGQTRRAVEYIRVHLASELRVEDVAAHAGLSAFHFSRAFKRTTGLSPHRFITRERILKAQELILARRLDLAQIALEVGYANPSHFAKMFAREVGVTPSKYRDCS